MCTLKVCPWFIWGTKTVLTASIELDDDDDPDATTESPEAVVPATGDTPLDGFHEPTSTKVHTEPSSA